MPNGRITAPVACAELAGKDIGTGKELVPAKPIKRFEFGESDPAGAPNNASGMATAHTRRLAPADFLLRAAARHDGDQRDFRQGEACSGPRDML